MNAIAGFSAASLAIRSCFVDTLSGFKAPSVFLKSDSVLRCSLPSAGSTRAPFPNVVSTIRALRLPAPKTRLLIFSLPRSHRSSPSSLPCSGDFRTGLVPFKPGTAGYTRHVEHRTSQVPGESIPYLCPALVSRPVHRPSHCRPDDAVPTLRTVKTLAARTCRDSITRLRYPLPTLEVMRYRTHMQGSLPVGG